MVLCIRNGCVLNEKSNRRDEWLGVDTAEALENMDVFVERIGT